MFATCGEFTMHAFARARRRRGTTVVASILAVLATALSTAAVVLPASTAQAAGSVAAAAATGPATGPIDPNTGYPFWYADGTGTKYELCFDRAATTPGMCLAALQNPSAR